MSRSRDLSNVLSGVSANLVFADGSGIDFGASAGGGATSELLDDYEEGTFTGTLHDALSGGNTSATTATGNYTKVGNVVYVSINFANISSAGMTSGQAVYFRGFPFTPNDVLCTGACRYDSITFPTASLTDLTAEMGFSSILGGYFTACGSGVGDVAVKWSGISSGTSDIFFSAFYFTNS